mmetsp:Transcript_63239/g.72503  ORF Transcript_63239/g.72503 Transcript_63239/m.72503 type:complete len:204 (+) Transcript_63239:250-861(+)
MMFLSFRGAIQAQAIQWLPLNCFINEISRFQGPAFRNIILLQKYLPRHNLILNFFSRLSVIRTATSHHLVCDYPDRKEIGCDAMILARHHLGCHISGRSACILGIVGMPDLCKLKVCQVHVSIFVKKNVFRLDVSMKNLLSMQTLQTPNKRGCNKSGLLFGELFNLCHQVPKVSPGHIVQHQIEIFSILKRIMHSDNTIIRIF